MRDAAMCDAAMCQAEQDAERHPTLVRAFFRACRLHCPRCGRGGLFRGWLAMRAACADCGLKFQREPGYFLGSIYFNYGITALLVTAAYLTLFLTTTIRPAVLMGVLLAFCLVFPLWFFRYARSLWLAMDHYFDPQQ
jgi:uncharacterized protein (DUF983 family)